MTRDEHISFTYGECQKNFILYRNNTFALLYTIVYIYKYKCIQFFKVLFCNYLF